MLTQTNQNRQPKGWQGVGLVALVALAAFAGSAFFTRLQSRLGAVASVLFIAYGCAIAYFLLNWYAMRYIYTANADCLRVCRAYGKRERFVTDVWLNQVTAYGTPEDVKARCPGAPVTQATRAQCELTPFALAHTQDGKTRILVIQPDEKMRAHLLGALKKKK